MENKHVERLPASSGIWGLQIKTQMRDYSLHTHWKGEDSEKGQ